MYVCVRSSRVRMSVLAIAEENIYYINHIFTHGFTAIGIRQENFLISNYNSFLILTEVTNKHAHTRISFYKKRLIRNTSQVHFCNKKRSLKQTSHFKNLRNATKNS